MTPVFYWPRRTLAERNGFPQPRLRSLFAAGLFLFWLPWTWDRAATAFAVKCLLQRLCHAPSNPYATVIVDAAHRTWAYFAARVDSNSTHVPAPGDTPQHDIRGYLNGGQPARSARGRALRRIPVT